MNHFWQMVWHETTEQAVIVMLTPLIEGQREKCYQYFPLGTDSGSFNLDLTDVDGNPHEGTMRVTDCSHDEISRSTIRTIELNGPDGRKKTVYHFHFLAWPDHGIPTFDDRVALRALFSQTRAQSGGWSNPRIVHCSAGVGRSGTFIALEHLLEELDAGHLDKFADEKSAASPPTAGPACVLPNGDGANGGSKTQGLMYQLPHRVPSDPIFQTVNRLREQRMYMVQSDTQYAFIYEFLADAYRVRHENLLARNTNATESPAVAPTTTPTSTRRAVPAPKPPAVRIFPPLRTSSLLASLPDTPASAPATTLSHPIGRHHPLETPTGAPAPAVMTPTTVAGTPTTPTTPPDSAPLVPAAEHRAGVTGEPSPKVIRLSRSFRNMLAEMQTKSVEATRRLRSAGRGGAEGKNTAPVEAQDGTGMIRGGAGGETDALGEDEEGEMAEKRMEIDQNPDPSRQDDNSENI